MTHYTGHMIPLGQSEASIQVTLDQSETTIHLQIVTPHLLTIPLQLAQTLILQPDSPLQRPLLGQGMLHRGVEALHRLGQSLDLALQRAPGNVDLEDFLVELLHLVAVLLHVHLPHTGTDVMNVLSAT